MPPKNVTPVLTPAQKAARTRAMKKAAKEAEEIATRARATEEASGAGKRLNKTADGRVIMNVYLKQLLPPATVHHTHYDEYTVPEQTIIIEKILEENDHKDTFIQNIVDSQTEAPETSNLPMPGQRFTKENKPRHAATHPSALFRWCAWYFIEDTMREAVAKAAGKCEAGGNKLARWKNLAIKFAFDAMKDPAEHDSFARFVLNPPSAFTKTNNPLWERLSAAFQDRHEDEVEVVRKYVREPTPKNAKALQQKNVMAWLIDAVALNVAWMVPNNPWTVRELGHMLYHGAEQFDSVEFPLAEPTAGTGFVSPVTAALGSNAGEFFVSQTHLRVSGGSVRTKQERICWVSSRKSSLWRARTTRLMPYHEALSGPSLRRSKTTHACGRRTTSGERVERKLLDAGTSARQRRGEAWYDTMDMTSNWTTVKKMKMEQRTTTKSKEKRLRERTKPPMGRRENREPCGMGMCGLRDTESESCKPFRR
jgi:hypothetical protein